LCFGVRTALGQNLLPVTVGKHTKLLYNSLKSTEARILA
jgi:hypothetical protein